MLVVQLFEKRFGPLSAAAREHMARCSTAQLQQLGLDLLDFTSGAELAGWLARHPSGAAGAEPER